MKYYNDKTIFHHLTYDELIPVIRKAYQQGEAETSVAPRSFLSYDSGEGERKSTLLPATPIMRGFSLIAGTIQVSHTLVILQFEISDCPVDGRGEYGLALVTGQVLSFCVIG